MKLYTEEQVKKAIIHFYANEYILNHKNLENSISTVTQIELPTNEEIEKQSFQYYADDFWAKLRFKKGAKWIIEQIKKQK